MRKNSFLKEFSFFHKFKVFVSGMSLAAVPVYETLSVIASNYRYQQVIRAAAREAYNRSWWRLFEPGPVVGVSASALAAGGIYKGMSYLVNERPYFETPPKKKIQQKLQESFLNEENAIQQKKLTPFLAQALFKKAQNRYRKAHRRFARKKTRYGKRNWFRAAY